MLLHVALRDVYLLFTLLALALGLWKNSATQGHEAQIEMAISENGSLCRKWLLLCGS